MYASAHLSLSVQAAGGKPNGLMPTDQFLVALKGLYREFTFKAWLLDAIVGHYGVDRIDLIGMQFSATLHEGHARCRTHRAGILGQDIS